MGRGLGPVKKNGVGGRGPQPQEPKKRAPVSGKKHAGPRADVGDARTGRDGGRLQPRNGGVKPRMEPSVTERKLNQGKKHPQIWDHHIALEIRISVESPTGGKKGIETCHWRGLILRGGNGTRTWGGTKLSRREPRGGRGERVTLGHRREGAKGDKGFCRPNQLERETEEKKSPNLDRKRPTRSTHCRDQPTQTYNDKITTKAETFPDNKDRGGCGKGGSFASEKGMLRSTHPLWL